MRPVPDLDTAIGRVVDSGNCSGCGACTLLDPGLRMRLAPDGFNRPVRAAAGTAAPDAVARFRALCPGVQVAAQVPEGARRHPTMGPFIQAFEAWATDPEIRFAGSSGGTLTALAAWLASTGEASFVVGSGPDHGDPRRTTTVRVTGRSQALAQAGSRYGPASNAADPGALDPAAAFIGKPCEVSAIRVMTRAASGETGAQPLLLSFFCAGTPSQRATDALVDELGVPASERLADLWYRGHGWPGRFTAHRADGSTVSASYEESWGRSLGPAVQWRCKVCADGVGESADLTAADLWRADPRGYPDFTDAPGVSALIARTRRGLDVVTRAVAAGVLAVRPIDIDELAAVQPLQRHRRETLAGRLLGTAVAGGRIPRYRGFSLLRLAFSQPRESLRVARGAYRRRRAHGNTDD